jgi:putative FmdB family regulatory protein
MPIYEYRCEACDHELEVIQKMSDPVLSECPECKRDSLKKVISAAAFRLKGSGWYETDFKGGSKKNIHDNGGGEAKAAKAESKSTSCNGGGCGCH